MDRERSRSRISRSRAPADNNNNNMELRRPKDREREHRERADPDRERELERRKPPSKEGQGASGYGTHSKPKPGDPDWIERDSKIEATTDPDSVALRGRQVYIGELTQDHDAYYVGELFYLHQIQTGANMYYSQSHFVFGTYRYRISFNFLHHIFSSLRTSPERNLRLFGTIQQIFFSLNAGRGPAKGKGKKGMVRGKPSNGYRFAFVTFEDAKDAQRLIASMECLTVKEDGKTIKIGNVAGHPITRQNNGEKFDIYDFNGFTDADVVPSKTNSNIKSGGGGWSLTPGPRATEREGRDGEKMKVTGVQKKAYFAAKDAGANHYE